MPELFEITNWSQLPWLSTGGTRDKKYIQHDDGDFYYFKTSLLKPQKDYRFEFWSEIISYEIGKMTEFDILKYDIAIDGNKIGCISKDMIDSSSEELKEGGRYLKAFDNTFNPENMKKRDMYSFQLIESALKDFQLDSYINNFIDVLIFDALIGNSDRHQENWSFITYNDIVERKDLKYRAMTKFYKAIGKEKIITLYLSKIKKFAPIYDNGSSLGRELSEDRIAEYLKSNMSIEKYVLKGKAEIHWENKKITHFELLAHLMKNHGVQIRRTIERINDKFDEELLRTIIDEIDESVPLGFQEFKISTNRKTFIHKMIILRRNELVKLVQ